MAVIVDGSIIKAKDEHPLKAPLSRVVTMDDSIIETKDEQPP